jgi:hypothetical protein
MGEIKHTPVAGNPPVAVVNPMIVPVSAASSKAAIDAVTADSIQANTLNNMKIGGWMPNAKTKVVKSKKVKVGGRRRSGRRSRQSRRQSRRRQSSAFDARVSRRLRLLMLQRRIKKRSSRRRKSLRLRLQLHGGSGGAGVPLQPESETTPTVPQHGASCTPGEPNCAGNITQGILSLNAQAVANSHGDTASKPASP